MAREVSSDPAEYSEAFLGEACDQADIVQGLLLVYACAPPNIAQGLLPVCACMPRYAAWVLPRQFCCPFLHTCTALQAPQPTEKTVHQSESAQAHVCSRACVRKCMRLHCHHPVNNALVFSGMSNAAYCNWIMQPFNWGGGIELAILSRYACLPFYSIS